MEVTKEQIKEIAKSMGKELTPIQINDVIVMYNEATVSWCGMIEDFINNIINN